VLGSASSDNEQGCERHIGEYRSLMERATALIQDRQIHFLFLHLPVPHPPGIYDRHTHRLRAGGNYLDNLTLADDTLGKLMQEIETSADGDRTTVIVSSDHSWRVPLWDSAPEWTKEEEEISHDTFDPRPVFLIHFPGETNGVEIRSAVPELEEHDIIAGILNKQIENGSQMAALLHTGKIRVAWNEEERSEVGQ
jgi:membrane-anchored protein YejM (alkaline phosphatase superfamily)